MDLTQKGITVPPDILSMLPADQQKLVSSLPALYKQYNASAGGSGAGTGFTTPATAQPDSLETFTKNYQDQFGMSIEPAKLQDAYNDYLTEFKAEQASADLASGDSNNAPFPGFVSSGNKDLDNLALGDMLGTGSTYTENKAGGMTAAQQSQITALKAKNSYALYSWKNLQADIEKAKTAIASASAGFGDTKFSRGTNYNSVYIRNKAYLETNAKSQGYADGHAWLDALIGG